MAKHHRCGATGGAIERADTATDRRWALARRQHAHWLSRRPRERSGAAGSARRASNQIGAWLMSDRQRSRPRRPRTLSIPENIRVQPGLSARDMAIWVEWLTAQDAGDEATMARLQDDMNRINFGYSALHASAVAAGHRPRWGTSRERRTERRRAERQISYQISRQIPRDIPF